MHGFHIPSSPANVHTGATDAWRSFRARLAHYLEQQRQLLVARNQPYTAFSNVSPNRLELPLEFPNDAFAKSGFIDFTEGKTRNIFQYNFSHDLPVQEWESPVWQIAAKQHMPGASWEVVGYVEFDSRVYQDPNPLTPLVDGEVMLRLMINSIQNGQGIRLASRVEAPLSPSGAPSLWNVETLEARATMVDGEGLVLDLGKRYVPKRSCSIPSCRAWLPATGPEICTIHFLG
ncbi:hypothetical protein C8R47DRAFT_1225201 [Mycena vitilis]|nr:hypothetical protein C8R47DRAFT_1225201 [Mycena vitilis]